MSFLTRVTKNGLSGFDDRRAKQQQQPNFDKIDFTFSIKENQIVLHFGNKSKTIHIPKNNPLQLKAIILTFLDNGMISRKVAAESLDSDFLTLSDFSLTPVCKPASNLYLGK